MSTPFPQSLAAFATFLTDLPDADAAARDAAMARNAVLTKPQAALGRLEELAIWYASWRGTDRPEVARPQALVFAGNHGVTARGISAFPPEVTAQMVQNFVAGGAAINQLCAVAGADLSVHAIDLDTPTADFTHAPAMSEDACLAALRTGWDAVDEKADLLITGEMGIGNTTSAAAIAAALFGGPAEDWVGRGTGVNDAGLARKAEVVRAGVARHAGVTGLDALACLGGRELAAMAGAISRARTLRIPVLIDGFICTAAAATLWSVSPRALDHARAAHLSAEGAHGRMLAAIGQDPLLSLGLRLGEGTGAALAINVLKGAVACLSDMATFAEAGVTDG